MRGLTTAEYQFLKQAADPTDYLDDFTEVEREVRTRRVKPV